MSGPPDMQTAALGWGDRRGNSKRQELGIYPLQTEPATDFPLAVLAKRFRLPLHVARTVCELAAIGGRFA